MLDRLKAVLGGTGSPATTSLPIAGEEPCEDCGAIPADDLVGVRWLCASCAPAARRAEGDDAVVGTDARPPGGPA
jgi:hypothetical protein